jgi:hypothetical protein
MKVNRKLTKLITGRTLKSFDLKDNLLVITFEDDSIIKIKTPLTELPKELQPSKIKDVFQDDNVIQFEYEDKTTAEIKLAEPASSVMLRDGKGVMEYAD